jgi:hypothetical protein
MNCKKIKTIDHIFFIWLNLNLFSTKKIICIEHIHGAAILLHVDLATQFAPSKAQDSNINIHIVLCGLKL